MKHTLLIACCVGLTLAGVAGAAEFPEYQQFRYNSGLPGGGYGVSPDGHISADGVLQVNIPVGYTPGFGNFALLAQTAAVNGGFPTDVEGPNVNGTISAGLGIFSNPAVWFTYMGTAVGAGLEPVYNLQVQLVPESARWPGIAVGGIDLTNQRASNVSDPFKGDARSFYLVATREAGSPETPLYVTLGVGNGRFNGVFGGVSYHPMDRLSLFAEWDGWNPNVGGAYDLFNIRNQWHGVLSLSAVDLERISISLALTKTSY